MSTTATADDRYSLFLKRVALAPSRVLLLDYDGTIAPFTPDRHRAVPYPKIPALLQRIQNSCSTRLIMVSGRAAREVMRLLGVHPAPEIWGTHGIERLNADGRYKEAHVSEEALQILTEAEMRLEQQGLGERIEVKLAGVAVHWRGLPASEILKIRTKTYRVLEPLTAHAELLLADFEEGVEIRLRSANKGEALRTLLDELDGDIPIAYLGDDATDEDAFRVLNDNGLSVLVGPKHRFTAAQIWLKPPDEVIRFLNDWIRCCGGAL